MLTYAWYAALSPTSAIPKIVCVISFREGLTIGRPSARVACFFLRGWCALLYIGVISEISVIGWGDPVAPIKPITLITPISPISLIKTHKKIAARPNGRAAFCLHNARAAFLFFGTAVGLWQNEYACASICTPQSAPPLINRLPIR